MTAVAGLRGSGDFATDERPKDFRNYILWRNPNGTAPLTALLGKMGKDKPADPEFNWWDEPNDIIRLQINYSTGYTSAATDLAVNSADPSVSAPGNVWGEATHLKAGDLMMVEKAEAATINNEIVMVSSVTSSTAFVVKRGVANTTPDTIPEDAFLTKIGSAYAEGTGAPDAASRNPMKYTNYCQIFKTSYELTNTAKGITNLRTGNALANDKKRKMFDHARDIEFALMFGQKYETTGTNGKPLRFMGGLRSFIPAANTTIFTTTPTSTTFFNAVYKVFDYDTQAGDQRIVFGGNGFMNELNKMALAQGTVNFKETLTVYGMKLREYVLPQGTLYFRTHPLLNRHPRYSYSAFIIDGSALRWRPFRDTRSQDNIQANDADTQKGQWLTEAGLEVRYGGLTCGYIGNFTLAA
jgi:hypothetical protein